MLFLGGDSRGERRYNGQNLNRIVISCEHVITNNITISTKWVKWENVFFLSEQIAFPSSRPWNMEGGLISLGISVGCIQACKEAAWPVTGLQVRTGVDNTVYSLQEHTGQRWPPKAKTGTSAQEKRLPSAFPLPFKVNCYCNFMVRKHSNFLETL